MFVHFRMNVKRRPFELLQTLCRDEEWYSVVVSRLDDWNIGPNMILSKVYLEGDDGSYQETNSAGVYKSCYATEEMFESGIHKRPFHNLSTTLDVYNGLSIEQKEIVDGIKGIANNFPTAIWWHDGQTDEGCQFIGLHIHMLVHCKEQLCQVYSYRNIAQRLKRHGVDVKSQRVRNLDALTRHLLMPPRTLLGCNNLQMCGLIGRLQGMSCCQEEFVRAPINFDEDEQPILDQSQVETSGAVRYMEKCLNMRQREDRLEKQRKAACSTSGFIEKLSKLDKNDAAIEMQDNYFRGRFEDIVKGVVPKDVKIMKPSKTASKVDVVKDFIRKYNEKGVTELLVAIMDRGSLEELETFRTLRLGPQFQLVFAQAVQELEIESQQKGETFIDLFADRCPLQDNVLSTFQTSCVYTDWCMEQNIITGEFMLELFCILDKVYPKRNCLMLQGASNAGKTFWTDPLMQVVDMVGQTIPSTDFAFQNCINKQIINIPELTFSKMEQVEEAKKIFEGLSTCINVKNREPVRLGRTPVILTCNQVPWAQFEKESKTLQNRMFAHKNLVKSRVLTTRTDHLSPDPRWYQEVFSFIRSEVIPKVEWPVAPGDVEWYLAVDLISEFISDKCNTGTQTLETVLDQASIDGGLEMKYYYEGYPSGGRLTNIDVGFYGYEQSDSEMLTRLLAWLSMLKQKDASDYYWDFRDYKKPKVICSLRHSDYDVDLDMDEEDYRSMKEGHALVSRLLMRTRNWPDFSEKDFTSEQRKRFMVRSCLGGMCQVLKYYVMNGKEWSRNKMTDVGMEVAFAAGVSAASTPRGMKRKFDKLETMTVSPLELGDAPRESKRVCQRKKLPVRRKLDFGERSFEAHPITDKKEILLARGITPGKAKDLLDYAYSGNQECYHQVEKECGVDMDFLADYAASSPESPLSSGYSDFEDTGSSVVRDNSKLDSTLNSDYENGVGYNPLNIVAEPCNGVGNTSDNPIVIE